MSWKINLFEKPSCLINPTEELVKFLGLLAIKICVLYVYSRPCVVSSGQFKTCLYWYIKQIDQFIVVEQIYTKFNQLSSIVFGCGATLFKIQSIEQLIFAGLLK